MLGELTAFFALLGPLPGSWKGVVQVEGGSLKLKFPQSHGKLLDSTGRFNMFFIFLDQTPGEAG